MAGNSRYDILFGPAKIGPETARNHFYQVPYCKAMGYRDPTANCPSAWKLRKFYLFR